MKIKRLINRIIVVPAYYLEVTEIVRCAVHPVAIPLTEVCDVLCLSAVTVVKDNAYCSFGNRAPELCLAVVIYDRLCLSCSGSLAADGVAVSVPSVYIRAAPVEVICEQEAYV